MDLVKISFPGLGIGEFVVNKVLFPLFGGLEIRWYGLIITLAIVVGFLYAYKKCKFEGVSTDALLDYAIYTVIFAVIGARAYYVLTTFNDGEHVYNSFYDVIAIWNGGIAIYGAIIAGAITIFVVSKIKKIKSTKVLDMVAPGVMIAQAIGRWGNFFNGEAHGTETDIFCRMGLSFSEKGEIWTDTIYVHPTFLYESLWNVIGFIIINALYKKKKYDGQIVLMYITWYGFGRMLVEGLRTDSLYLFEDMLGETIRVSLLVGALCFVIGTALLIVFGIKAKNARLAEADYERVYNIGTQNVEGDAEITAEATTEETEKDGEEENGKDN